MIQQIAHVGIAVRDLKVSIPLFERLLGARVSHRERVDDQKVETAMIGRGDGSIELLAPTEPSSPIARFLDKRGEGIHHLSYLVDDIEAELTRLKGLGFELIDESPRAGAGNSLIAFVHPRSAGGVLVELCQKRR